MRKPGKEAILTELRLLKRVEHNNYSITEKQSEDTTFYIVSHNSSEAKRLALTPDEAYRLTKNNWIRPKESLKVLGKGLQTLGTKIESISS